MSEEEAQTLFIIPEKQAPKKIPRHVPPPVPDAETLQDAGDPTNWQEAGDPESWQVEDEDSKNLQEAEDLKNWQLARSPEGGQYKGYGKGGSLGLPLGSNGTDAAHARVIPPPLPVNTDEDIHKMFRDRYYSWPDTPFWDGRNIWDVVKGSHALWKSVPTGKSGGESTKVEYFHGHVHGWQNDNVIIS